MSFQPSVPLTGIGGWCLLERTEATQPAALVNTPSLKRDHDPSPANITEAHSAAYPVTAPTLVPVALGALVLETEAA